VKKLILSVSAVILLAGCAHVAPPHVAPVVKQHVVKPVAKPAPVVPATPNAVVKKRWYSHFPHHPKWFHSK